MSLDIKTSNLKPRRQSYAYIARRYGADKPASRYDEAVLDVQARENFHYRPLWAPEYELHDPRRTRIQMEDWYALRDPRQFYYATYNISRAAMNASNEKNFEFVESRDMVALLDEEWRQKVLQYVLPMRHYEWGANMNNYLVTDYGYGTAITSAAAFCAADRLGMAQILSKMGLVLDDQTASSLDTAKHHWMEDEALQPTRHALEDSFVLDDWFEAFVAQNLCFDGILHPLVYREVDAEGQKHGGTAISLMTEFMTEWFADNSRWVDAVVKTAAKESDSNAEILREWVGTWQPRAVEAGRALAKAVLGDEGEPAVEKLDGELNARLKKLGL